MLQVVQQSATSRNHPAYPSCALVQADAASGMLDWTLMELCGDLSPYLPVLRLPAALEPVVRHTLAGRDRLHLFERHRYRAAAEEPLAGAEHQG
jgi:hypothetical protein